MIDPYKSPSSSPVQEPDKIIEPLQESSPIKDFLSLSGSFSRTELLIASLVIAGLFYLRGLLLLNTPDGLIFILLAWSALLFYILWGIAIGKRSRDLGTTFTYGMIIGMLFPIIGIIFLFQDGKKYKSRNSAKSS